RVAFSVMSFKCEYVGDLAGELEEYKRKNDHLRAALTRTYAQAAARRELRPGLDPEVAALETLVFVAGLMRLWLLGSTSVRRDARAIIRAHVKGRAAPATPGEPARRPRRAS